MIDAEPLSPAAALARLVEGNRRFHERTPNNSSDNRRLFDPAFVEGQRPFAIVVGCSDSRTPVEIIFDEGFGDLFVVRVAGPVVAPSIVGSVEFAASTFGTRLVVVLGHTNCGAIRASMNVLRTGDRPESRNIRAITDRIVPQIRGIVRNPGTMTEAQIARAAMRCKVEGSADDLRHGSQLLEELVLAGQVAVVGADYDLETGKVDFFDGLPLERQRARHPTVPPK
jgi:carbonic anhydrase